MRLIAILQTALLPCFALLGSIGTEKIIHNSNFSTTLVMLSFLKIVLTRVKSLFLVLIKSIGID